MVEGSGAAEGVATVLDDKVIEEPWPNVSRKISVIP